jgi:hypothetical protein
MNYEATKREAKWKVGKSEFEPMVCENPIDSVLNVPIETDEDLASLGQIYTD